MSLHYGLRPGLAGGKVDNVLQMTKNKLSLQKALRKDSNREKTVKMRKAITFLAVAAVLASACNAELSDFDNVIPAPQEVTRSEGEFLHKPWTKIAYATDETVPAEGYVLEVTPKSVRITSSDDAGRYYARQTLAQATGIDETLLDRKTWKVQCCKITDSPRFAYRGLLMDVSRHFRSKEFVLKHLDAMAAVKLNRLHFHLTDEAGWRIQIDAFPRLTEIGAYRTAEFRMDPWEYCEPADSGAYGGFYTKDDIREIVAYAQERHITIVPEIEMPGHSNEVLAAYPELKCTGDAESGDLCPGKEATFEFIEKVLDEVMELFPSEYIHIGGDEAVKRGWKVCDDCKARMEAEGLSSMEELQGYLTRRVEEYVNSKGRHVIGWDEILEGGLGKEATVMSWRGLEGGQAAIAAGHKAIMTPGFYCYIDATQDFPNKEPAAFGNYLPINRVYSYDPAEGISDTSLLLGVQANLWSEMIIAEEHAEYMYWPRGLALAEVAWTNPERKDLQDFRRRAILRGKKMTELGYTVFDLEDEAGERAEALAPQEHLAVGARVVRAPECDYTERYSAGGDNALTDGLCGGWAYTDGKWQGYLCDVDFTIDLGEVKDISSITLMSMQNRVHGVYLPESVEFFMSANGLEYEFLGSQVPDVKPDVWGARICQFGLSSSEPSPVRYIMIRANRCDKGGFLFFDEVIVK